MCVTNTTDVDQHAANEPKAKDQPADAQPAIIQEQSTPEPVSNPAPSLAASETVAAEETKSAPDLGDAPAPVQQTPLRQPPAVEPRCLNCNEPLLGQYCAHCGQSIHHHIHSTWAAVSEFIEDLFHADHRVWRTLFPLLFKPGLLTVEYLRGRRVSYTPPFRLYIVLSLIFFLFASFDQPATAPNATAQQSGQRQDPCEITILDALPGQLGKQQRVIDACRTMTSGSEDFARVLSANISKMMFLFLPLIALVGKVLYAGSRRYYAEHLLFFVHFHAFFFLATTIGVLVSGLLRWLHRVGAGPWNIAADLLTAAIVIYVPIYLYRAMRRMYGQGRFVTTIKFAVLTVAYLVTLLSTFLLLLAVTALSL